MENLKDIKRALEDAVEGYGKIKMGELNDFIFGGCLWADDADYYHWINDRSLIPRSKRIEILEKGEWTYKELRNLIKKKEGVKEDTLKKRIENAFNLNSDIELDKVIQEQIFSAIFGGKYPVLCKNMYRKKLCCNFVSTGKSREIEEKFTKSNIVVVEGPAAIGKTQLVKEYLSELNLEKWEISWNEILANEILKEDYEEETLKERMEKIKVVTMEKGDVISVFQKCESNLILVFECANFKNSDYEFLKENFWGRTVRILITTRKNVTKCEFPVVKVNRYSMDVLYTIYKNITEEVKKENILKKEELETICKIVDYNTLAVVLLAKTMRSPDWKKWEISKEELLKEEFWFVKGKGKKKEEKEEEKKMPIINEKSYLETGSRRNMFCILHTILFKFGLIPKKMKSIYSVIAVWAKYEISKEQLIYWCTASEKENVEEAVEKLINSGIMLYTDKDEKNVKMQSLTSDLIWYENAISYKECEKYISRFINSVQVGEIQKITYRMLYETTWNITYQFGIRIGQERSKKRQKQWWKLVEYLIYLLVQYGNARRTEDMVKFLQDHCDAKKVSDEITEDLAITRMEIQMMQGRPMTEFLDYLIEKIGQSKEKQEGVKYVRLAVKFIERADYIIPIYADIRNGIFLQKQIQLIEAYVRLLSGGESEEFDYYQGMLNYLNSYRQIGEQKTQCKVWGRINFLRCIIKTEESGNQELNMKSKIRLLYYQLLDILIDGVVNKNLCESLELECSEIIDLYASHLWSWEIAILYRKTEMLYAMYEALVTGDVRQLLLQYEEVKNLFQNQIMAFNDENEQLFYSQVEASKSQMENMLYSSSRTIEEIWDIMCESLLRVHISEGVKAFVEKTE